MGGDRRRKGTGSNEGIVFLFQIILTRKQAQIGSLSIQCAYMSHIGGGTSSYIMIKDMAQHSLNTVPYA